MITETELQTVNGVLITTSPHQLPRVNPRSVGYSSYTLHVANIVLPSVQGCGLAVFANAAGAQKAIETLNGVKPWPDAYNPLLVKQVDHNKMRQVLHRTHWLIQPRPSPHFAGSGVEGCGAEHHILSPTIMHRWFVCHLASCGTNLHHSCTTSLWVPHRCLHSAPTLASPRY